MGAPVRPAGSGINPLLVLVGALILVALVGVGVYAYSNGSKGSPAPSGGGSSPTAAVNSPTAAVNSPTVAVSQTPTAAPSVSRTGSMVFSPKTISCGATLTVTITLPSSVSDSEKIILLIDGEIVGTHTVVEAGMKKQADGSWYVTGSGPVDCTLGAGKHTEMLVDLSANLLAEGSFTLTASASAKPTTVSAGSITFTPSSWSCSAASVQVTEAVRLPASIAGSSQMTSEIDGQGMGTGTVSSTLKKQSDGSWYAAYTNPSATLCGLYDPGKHTVTVKDQSGQVIAEGTFTVKP